MSEQRELPRNVILHGDALAILQDLPSESVQCVVTSPPYFRLRSYLPEGHQDKAKEIGMEETPGQYVARLVEVFREIKRVLRKDGVCWLNLADTYGRTGTPYPEQGKTGQRADRTFTVSGIPANGQQDKQLLGIPWRVAFALQDDGWLLRSDVVWAKGNALPESVQDRPTKAHEYVFLLAKSQRYFYDAEAIKETATYAGKVVSLGSKSFSKGQALGAGTAPSGNGLADTYAVLQGRNKRSVWHINTEPHPEAHFAVMPTRLVEPCILAGSAPCACETCGAPWQRVVKQGRPQRIGGMAGVSVGHAEGPMDRGGKGQWDQGHMPMVRPITTIGWEPGCKCKANTGAGRCIVLDPFSGAGTVALVASQMGRDYLGIELNAEYIEMAERRIRTGGKRQKKLPAELADIEQPTLWAV